VCVCAWACQSYLYKNDSGEGGYCIVFANPTAYCTYKLDARHQKKRPKFQSHLLARGKRGGFSSGAAVRHSKFEISRSICSVTWILGGPQAVLLFVSLTLQFILHWSRCASFHPKNQLLAHFTETRGLWYGVATIRRLLKMIGLFCKRAL